jgi:hypothetical protein
MGGCFSRTKTEEQTSLIQTSRSNYGTDSQPENQVEKFDISANDFLRILRKVNPSYYSIQAVDALLYDFWHNLKDTEREQTFICQARPSIEINYIFRNGSNFIELFDHSTLYAARQIKDIKQWKDKLSVMIFPILVDPQATAITLCILLLTLKTNNHCCKTH